MRHATRSRQIVLIAALLAVSLPPAARLVVGPHGATVHVRWEGSIDADARKRLEARLHLTDGRNQEEHTWRYDLRDTSRDNIRAIVLDPAVADTHYINRSAFSLEPTVATTARRQHFAGGDLVVEVADLSAMILVTIAALFFVGRASSQNGHPATGRRPMLPVAHVMSTLSPRRALTVLVGNAVIFVGLFLLLEIGVRINRDGPRAAFAGLFAAESVPYSNVGTGNWIIYDDELGYRLNPAQDGAHVNSRSVRGPEIVVPKPPGLFRIVVLGDSIPWDVPGFVGPMADQLKHAGSVEVINASVPGYTSYQESLFFKRYLLQAEPDLVLWAYCLNDNHTFLHMFDENARMLMTPEALESVQIRSKWDWLVSRSYVLSSLHIAYLAIHRRAPEEVEFEWEGQPDFNTAWKDDSWPVYEDQLREMTELIGSRNARLAVVVFPYGAQLRHRSRHDKRDYILAPQRHLAELCGRYSIPCLDLFPVFERAYDGGDTLFRDGIHLNPEGHRLTAMELLKFLRLNELLPADSDARSSASPK